MCLVVDCDESVLGGMKSRNELSWTWFAFYDGDEACGDDSRVTFIIETNSTFVHDESKTYRHIYFRFASVASWAYLRQELDKQMDPTF